MDTKDMILSIAFKGFLNQGFEKISLNELISRTGLSKGTFYYHFKNKDELLTEVIKKYFYGFISKQMDEAKLEGQTMEKSALIAIQAITDATDKINETCEMQVDTRSFFLLFYEGLRKDQRLVDLHIELGEKNCEKMVYMIKSRQKSGELRSDLTAKELSKLTNTYFEGVLSKWLYKETGALEDSINNNLLSFFKLIKNN